VQATLAEAGTAFWDAALAALAAGADYAGLVARLKATGRSGAALFRPLRLALTQRSDGPELHTLLALLPPETTRARLAAARALAAATPAA
jgi:glutamyl-tRNA synthetase